MHYFQYKNNHLCSEDVPVHIIAEAVGTPLYLYSHRTLVRHFKAFDSAFDGLPHLICYSVKANSNAAVMKTFLGLGGGFDIVSAGELYRALRVGADPRTIVYSGVGKRDDEIRYALDVGILMFNAESFQELRRINDIASEIGIEAPVSFRVNPDIDPETHPYISTGLKKAKFGVAIEHAIEGYREAVRLPYLKVRGVSCHIGSQLTDLDPFVEALRRVKTLVSELRSMGIDLQYVDLGGGLGITYHREEPPHPKEYAAALMHEANAMNCTFIFEPGRVIVGNAGILVARVLYTKEGAKNFVVVDAAMNDLVRPTLYGSYQEIVPVERSTRGEIVADMVGPICESGDFLARDRVMPRFQPGDLVAIMGAGAYGFSMSSNYNSRPRPAEVLVKNDQFFVVRRRESYEDLVVGEVIPPFLQG